MLTNKYLKEGVEDMEGGGCDFIVLGLCWPIFTYFGVVRPEGNVGVGWFLMYFFKRWQVASIRPNVSRSVCLCVDIFLQT